MLATVALVLLPVSARGSLPDVVFVLLDTTRADRMSAWGAARETTPTLDALAARGTRFRRHHANAHATRSSMPQLMSGRYYHRNVLGAFRTDAHPREFSFTRRDPTAALLPEMLRQAGYRTLGVSAHAWVIAESVLGRHFDRLELVPFAAEEGHGDAVAVVDAALAAWEAHEGGAPLFLYLHLMDAHLPRPWPATASDRPAPGWEKRFKPGGEPAFAPERRRWSRADARDFTEGDRRHFAHTYDVRLRHADGELGRLLAAIERRDPGLARTLVIVAADHGEELGEDGRTEHTQSLADGVQHVPWIIAGAGVPSGRVHEEVTENVDVVPTVLQVVGLEAPEGIVFDGRPRLGSDGAPSSRRRGGAAYYAWEEYRAIRTKGFLLRQERPRSPRARCGGEERLYGVGRAGGLHRLLGSDWDGVARVLRGRLERRLDRRRTEFEAGRYTHPRAAVRLPADFWRLRDGPPLICLVVGSDTPRSAFAVDGWTWSARGVTVLGKGKRPLEVSLDLPDGEYVVEAAGVRMAPMPRWFGFGHWRRQSFLEDEPDVFTALGSARAENGELTVSLPASAATGVHVLGLRVRPAELRTQEAGAAVDAEQERRLRALGYVQ